MSQSPDTLFPGTPKAQVTQPSPGADGMAISTSLVQQHTALPGCPVLPAQHLLAIPHTSVPLSPPHSSKPLWAPGKKEG